MSAHSSDPVNSESKEFVVQQGKGTRYGQVPLWMLKTSKPSEIVIYLALTGYINLPDGARPSVKRLAEDTGLSAAQVERGIRAMREARILLVHQRWEGKRQLPSRYVLAFDGPFHESQVPTMRVRKRGAIVSDGTYAIVDDGTVPSPVRDEVDTEAKQIQVDTVNYYSDSDESLDGVKMESTDHVKAESKDAPDISGVRVGWITTSNGRRRINRTDERIHLLMSELIRDYRPDWQGDETGQLHDTWHTTLYTGMTDNVLKTGWSNREWRTFLTGIDSSGEWDRLDSCWGASTPEDALGINPVVASARASWGFADPWGSVTAP